jgi:hypothetical protein
VDGTELTDAGRQLRADIERETDLATREVIERLGDQIDELFSIIEPWSQAIVAGGGYPVDPSKLMSVTG